MNTLKIFSDKVLITSDCWKWNGSFFSNGYGQFGPEFKEASGNYTRRAHRVSYEIFNGPIPDGMLVLHKCDNRWCVNPAHLFIGTSLDNNKDMFRKNRANKPKGSQHGFAKLTEDVVEKIRKDFRLHREIAEDYGVSRPTITQIKNKRLWKHI